MGGEPQRMFEMRRILAAMLLAVIAGAGLSDGAHAAKYKVLYSFCAQAGCVDGADPWASPVGDGKGNYYGTTAGSNGQTEGTIYRMSFAHNKWTYTLLYTFCLQKKCPDGSQPHGALIRDIKGNLYGTTQYGGDANKGVVYELSPGILHWRYTRLYSFCSAKGCADGENPIEVTLTYQGAASGAPYDGKSALFGATTGNRTRTHGTVFSLTPAKTGWTMKVLYSFCALANCADGADPYSGPMVDGAGNLFGAAGGGAFGEGALYELMRQGKGYQEVVLYSFCPATGCDDGTSPLATPVMDGAGNLYGTATAGGAGAAGRGQGTVYRLVPNGTKSTFTKLYDFCNKTNCTDGDEPWAGLAIDPHGNLLGTTFLGGDANAGTIFELSGKALTTFKRLVSLGSTQMPGGFPLSAPVPQSAKTYIGTTADGGDGNQGVIYELTP